MNSRRIAPARCRRAHAFPGGDIAAPAGQLLGRRLYFDFDNISIIRPLSYRALPADDAVFYHRSMHTQYKNTAAVAFDAAQAGDIGLSRSSGKPATSAGLSAARRSARRC